jgi:hypothetical protein
LRPQLQSNNHALGIVKAYFFVSSPRMIPEISAFVRKAVRTGGLKRGNHQSHPEIVALTVFISMRDEVHLHQLLFVCKTSVGSTD